MRTYTPAQVRVSKERAQRTYSSVFGQCLLDYSWRADSRSAWLDAPSTARTPLSVCGGVIFRCGAIYSAMQTIEDTQVLIFRLHIDITSLASLLLSLPAMTSHLRDSVAITSRTEEHTGAYVLEREEPLPSDSSRRSICTRREHSCTGSSLELTFSLECIFATGLQFSGFD